LSVFVCPHIPILFSNPYFLNPLPFPPKNIETEVEIGFFRPFSSGYDGFGLSYRCGKCDFDLHEHCVMYPPTTSVPFHAQHAVEFEAEAAMFPENPDSCNLCSAL
jgi:hypothetical protein